MWQHAWTAGLPNVVIHADQDNKFEAILARNDIFACQKRSDALQADNESLKRQKTTDF